MRNDCMPEKERVRGENLEEMQSFEENEEKYVK